MMRIISGPTGASKSSWAERAAKQFDLSLFNADVFQFYRGIPILSNQSTGESAHRYRFLADRDLTEPRNAGDFSREVLPLIASKGIWVGTGLYISAVLYGLDEERVKGTPFQSSPRCDYRMVVFNPLRDQLYKNLNDRVDKMIERGAMKEAEFIYQLLKSGQINSNLPILKAIGLKHLLEYLRGECNLDRAIDLWKRDSRRLAKRQWTWLKKFSPPSDRCLWVSDGESGYSKWTEFLQLSNDKG